MGLGKTVSALTVIDELIHDEFYLRKVLVIAPKNVAENVWGQEIQKWSHLHRLSSSLVSGTAKKREAALRKKADIYILGRDNLVWLTDLLGDKWDFDGVILDELSSFKNPNTKRFKALRKYITKCKTVWGLTGTPAPNSYLDLWSQVYLLDSGERLGKRITDYRMRYFTMGAHKGHIVYEWKLRIGAQDAINRKLSDLCLSMRSEDWLNLPPIIYNTIPVAMSEAARKDYEVFKRDKVIPLLRQAEETKRLDPNNPDDLRQMTNLIQGDTAATVAGKLLQMANGAVYDDAGGVLEIHDAKLDALAEIMESAQGESLLVFYSYQHDRDRILARFTSARVFSGNKDVEDWNAGRIPMLLCHPASTGHGLNLQHGGHIIVWYGLTWSLELYQQANARLPRPGQTKSVIIHHIVCRDTIDERVMNALKGKEDGQNTLLNALKGYLGDS
jgi:SNF2 family DNA or RNA helicase